MSFIKVLCLVWLLLFLSDKLFALIHEYVEKFESACVDCKVKAVSEDDGKEFIEPVKEQIVELTTVVEEDDKAKLQPDDRSLVNISRLYSWMCMPRSSVRKFVVFRTARHSIVDQ